MLALLIAIHILLSAASTPTVAVGPCAVPAAVPASWLEVSGSAFTLRLPKEAVEVPVQNPDLEAGGWSWRGGKLVYEFGTGSNPLIDGPPERDRSVCEAKISGHLVRIVTGRAKDGSWMAAGFWADLGRISSGPSSLSLIGTAADSIGQREILSAMWTVVIQK